jgi:hypothetical protein
LGLLNFEEVIRFSKVIASFKKNGRLNALSSVINFAGIKLVYLFYEELNNYCDYM